jgi:uncharacterized membrane protein YgcG
VPPVNDAPAELVELAIAALNFDPHVRPKAADVARQLRGWLARLAEAQTVVVAAVPPTAVVPVAAPRSSRAPIRRPPALALVAGALVLVGLIGGSIALSNGFGHPTATHGPATAAPTPVPDLPTLPPTQAPANNGSAGAAGNNNGGGGSGAGHQGGSGGNGNRGDNGNHGGNGRGNGHGKGN